MVVRAAHWLEVVVTNTFLFAIQAAVLAAVTAA